MQLLKFDLVRASQLESFPRQPGGGEIESLDSVTQRARLFSIRQELNLQGQLHASDYPHIGGICLSSILRDFFGWRFLCELKHAASAPDYGRCW
jgi:hypothetical protein